MADPDRSAAFNDEVALLWVARESGVLDALLSSAGTPAAVAEAAGVEERAARVLVRALADRGFFERVDGVYEPTNRALGFLARRDLRSVGTLPYRADLLERVAALPEGIAAGGDGGGDGDRDGAEPGEPPTPTPGGWRTARLGAVAATDESVVRALVTAAVREAPDADRVVDVGGAPGPFAREFAARGFEVVLAAPPGSAGPSRRFLSNAAVEVVTADPAGEGARLPAADLAFVPDRSHRLAPAANRRLIGTVADALDPGGTAVVVDRVRDSPGATATALSALATTPGGEVYGADRYREWLAGAGFADPAVRPVPGTDRHAAVGALPE